jgi:hypothetical protein
MPTSLFLSAFNRIKAAAASVSGERQLSIKSAKADKPPLSAEELELEKAYYKEIIDNLPPPHKNSAKAIELMRRANCEHFKADFDYETMKSMYGAEIADSVFHK